MKKVRGAEGGGGGSLLLRGVRGSTLTARPRGPWVGEQVISKNITF